MKKQNILVSLLVLLSFCAFRADADSKHSFAVDIVGKGKQSVILIPGLTCPGSVWNETVEQFKGKYNCHIITLPGFAGQPASPQDFYLKSMRDEIIQYIKANKLKKVILVGHSLGGFLSLWISSTEPDLVKSVIIVDSLPFLAATQNPNTTPESAKPQAEKMRKMMAGANAEQVKQSQKYFLPGMINNPEKLELVSKWGIESDQPTVAQAMYELQTTDLRDEIQTIKAPVLVLGAWIAYQQYGATKESTYKIFETQYQKLAQKRIVLSDSGKHFLMYDDPTWFYSQVNEFLSNPKI